MANKREQKELKRVLEQIKKEDRQGKSRISSDRAAKEGTKAEVQEPGGWQQELKTGMPGMALDSVLLFVGIYLFSLVYKLLVSDQVSMGQDSVSSVIYYVNPIFGVIGILLLFLLKNIYDVRFFRIQRWAKEHHRKLLRVCEWFLYVVLMFIQEIFTFANFSCGRNFFDTYTFENAILGNIAYTMLYIILPLLYPIQAIVRLIFDQIEKKKATEEDD